MLIRSAWSQLTLNHFNTNMNRSIMSSLLMIYWPKLFYPFLSWEKYSKMNPAEYGKWTILKHAPCQWSAQVQNWNTLWKHKYTSKMYTPLDSLFHKVQFYQKVTKWPKLSWVTLPSTRRFINHTSRNYYNCTWFGCRINPLISLEIHRQNRLFPNTSRVCLWS